MPLVVAFLIGCVVLLGVGCSGVRSGASKKELGHSPEATASEEARCEGTRTFHDALGVYTTNDLPGCPKGGLLEGTNKTDLLSGKHGDDEVRGLGGRDLIVGGVGNDVIYAGDGNDDFRHPGNYHEGEGDDIIYGGSGDDVLQGLKGEDVIYGGDGDDVIDGQSGEDGQRDKLYCGKGKDQYLADKNDYVDSSCEYKQPSNYFMS
jgi:hypothetical protein